MGRLRALRPQLPLLLGVGLVVLAWWRVLSEPGELFQVDLTYSLHPEVESGFLYPMWNPTFGSNLPAMLRFFLWGAALTVGRWLGLETAALLRGLFLVFALLGYASAYWLYLGTARLSGMAPTRGLRWGGALGALIFALSPPVLVRVHQFFLFTQILAMPLVLALLVHALRTRRLAWALAAGAAFAWLGSTNPHYVVFTGIAAVVLTFFAYGWLDGTRRARLARAAGTLGTLVLTLALFKAHVWLPWVLMARAGGVSGPAYVLDASSVEQLNVRQDFGNTLRLSANHFFGEDIQGEGWRGVAHQALALALPACLLFGMAVMRGARRGSAFFVALALVFVLGMGAAGPGPLQPAFARFVITAPLGWVFREAEKAAGVLSLAYGWGLMVALVGLLELARRTPRRYNRLASSVLALTVAAALLLAVAWPAWRLLWDTAAFNWIPREVPGQIREDTAWLNAYRPNGRMLLVSDALRNPEWDRRRMVGQFELRWIDHPIERMALSGLTPAQTELLQSERPADLLRALGVSDIVFIHDFPEGRRAEDRLRPALEGHVVRETTFMTLFQLAGEPAPKLALLHDPDGTEGLPGVTWQQESATRYVVEVPSGAGGHLVLHEPFDPLWRASTPQASLAPSPWLDTQLAWPAGELAGQRVEIEYLPQRWTETGLAITSASVVLAVLGVALQQGWRVRARRRLRRSG